jgi:hypothetical protein
MPVGEMYSVVVDAHNPVLIPRLRMVLDRGRNVFSAILADPDDFTSELKGQGLEVVAIHRIGEISDEPLPVLV